MAVQHNLEDQEFTLTRDGATAEMAYSRPAEGLINITHTYADDTLRGQGVGDELARAALAYAREKHLKLQASCSFMANFVKRHHGEFADVLA